MTGMTPDIEAATPQPDDAKPPDQSPAPEIIYCANHPDVETLLRCNRCGKPICLKCAQLTDVGYRCNECIRGVQDTYFNAKQGDNTIAFVVALLVTAVTVPIAGFLFGIFRGLFGFIIAFMIGGAAGGILTQIIRRAIDRRRSRQLRYVAVAGIIVGILLGVVLSALFLPFPPLSWPLLLFAVLAAMSTYQLLR